MKPEDLESLFAANLRMWRMYRKMSQVRLAEAAEIPQPHVSALERGTMAPTLQTIAKLAEALDVTPSTLIASAMTPTVSTVAPEKILPSALTTR